MNIFHTLFQLMLFSHNTFEKTKRQILKTKSVLSVIGIIYRYLESFPIFKEESTLIDPLVDSKLELTVSSFSDIIEKARRIPKALEVPEKRISSSTGICYLGTKSLVGTTGHPEVFVLEPVR